MDPKIEGIRERTIAEENESLWSWPTSLPTATRFEKKGKSSRIETGRWGVRLGFWLHRSLLAAATISLLCAAGFTIRDLPELQPLDCDLEQSIRSTEGIDPTSIDFVNSTAMPVNVYWIDYTGHRVLYVGGLRAGASYTQLTFLTHPWVITNLSDQCIVMFLPVATAARATIKDTRPHADLSINITGAPDPVSSGGRITYVITVDNLGPDAASSVIVTDALPPGVTFASAASALASLTTPPIGGAGTVTANVGALSSGSSFSVSATVNVLAPANSSVANKVSVTTGAVDPNPTNNSAVAVTAVRGGAIVQLVWEQPPPTFADPTPAPINLRVQVEITPTLISVPQVEMTPAADACMLIAVNIYKSESQPVQSIPVNLWKSVPPTQLATTMAAAPGGSFFVITNVWQCGDTTVESGGSNQAGVPAGPTINRMKVGGKIKAVGEGFTDPAEMFLDGVGFKKQASFRDSTLIVQKGALTDGRFIGDVVTAGKTVVISVRNSNGGVSSLAFTAQ